MNSSPQTERARRIWDRSAPGYDRQMAFLERHWFTGGRDWLTARAAGRILDVGIGTGRNLPGYPPGTTITGLDISPAMLAIAGSRAADLGIPADLREGDAERLPFGDGTFDTVVCALALCGVANPRAAITEMWRVLVPGGRLLLLDHVASTSAPVRAAQWLLERFTVPVAGEHFTRRQRPLAEAAGFQVVEAMRTRAGTVERLHATKTA